LSRAAVLTWAPGGAGGGVGNWDTSAANWNGRTSTWSNTTPPNAAVFGGTSGIVTLTAPISVGDITFNSSGYTLNGNQLTLAATGSSFVTGAGITATVSSALTGSGSLIKSGAGTLNVRNINNSYSGGTVISQGTLVFGQGATPSSRNNFLGSGTITLGDANTGTGNVALLMNYGNFFTPQTVFGNNIVVSSQARGQVTIGTTSFNPGTNGSQYSGTITLQRDVTLQGGNADRTTYIGRITGTGNITVTGARTTFQSGGTHDFRGSVTITSGALLQLSGANELPATTDVTIDAGGVLDTANAAANQVIRSLNGAGTFLGSITGHAASLTVGANDGSGTFSGVIQNGGSVRVIKTGSGTQVFSGTANTYAGSTTLNGGILSVARLANGGVASSIGQSASAAGNLVFNGGTLQYTGAAASTNRLFTLNGSGTLDASGSGALTFSNTGAVVGNGILTLSGSSTADNTLTPVIGGTSSLIKAGSGTWVLTGNNSYTGGTAINGGVLRVAGNAQLGDAAGPLSFDGGTLNTTSTFSATRATTLNAGGGTLQVAAGTTLTLGSAIAGPGGLTKTDGGTLVLTSDNTYAGTTTVSGGTLQLGNGGTSGSIVGDVVNNAALVFDRSDTLAFTQQGTGTTVLSGANSYSGATDVVQGTLVVNGDQSLATGATTVRGGATLAGTGTLGGPVNVQGAATLSPGQGGPGTLTIGPLALDGGAVLQMDLGARGVAGGALNDLVVVNGNLALDGTVNVASTPGTSFDPGLYRLINYTGALANNTLDIGTLPASAVPGAVSVQTAIPNQINLINASGTSLRFWDGPTNHDNGVFDGASGLWRATTDRNWTDADPAVNGSWADNAFAVFLGTPGTVTVDASAGQVNLAGAQFAVDGYIVGGLDALHTSTEQTVIRVGDGTAAGRGMTAAINAPIAGTGRIVKSDLGTLVLGGDNTYTGGTTIGAGTLQISRDANLGDAAGALALDGGTLRVTQDLQTARAIDVRTGGGAIDTAATTMTSTGPLSGAGDWTKLGTGTLVLAGANTASGTATVAAGTLRAGAAGALGPAARYAVGAGATLDLAGFDQTVAGLTNAGTVSLSGRGAPSTLTVRGGYVGQNGVMRMAGMLAGNESPVDKLVIDGGSASGRTTIQFTNLGGLGAQTTGNGIELVGARNGATTTAQTTRDAFSLAGGLVSAGAFEYRLQPGDAAGAGESWYLRSTLPADPGSPVPPSGQPTTYRPEVALNAAVPAALGQGDLAMLGTLHQREGDPAFVTNGDDVQRRGAWARLIHQQARIRQEGTVSPRSDASYSGMQAGVDVFATAHHRLGLYGGTLRWNDRVSGFASGIRGQWVGGLDGRTNYLGLYWTYRAESGWYSDVVLQRGWYDGRADASSASHARIGGHSLNASIEIGRRFRLNEHWGIEPQAQVIVGKQRLDRVVIPAAVLEQSRDTHTTARFGVRLIGDYESGAGRFKPYARFNLWRGFGGTDHLLVAGPGGGTRIDTKRGYTSAELAVGGTWALNRQVDVYGELGYVSAVGGDEQMKLRPSASIGARLSW
jgi:autotransporter-associated beta strand protein